MTKVKTGGRTIGTPNKTQKQIREYYQLLIEENLELISNDLKQLRPEQRLKFLIELSKYVIPQLKSMELINPNNEKLTNIINLGSGINPELD